MQNSRQNCYIRAGTELGGVLYNTKEVIKIKIALEEMEYPQPHIPIHIINSMASIILH